MEIPQKRRRRRREPKERRRSGCRKRRPPPLPPPRLKLLQKLQTVEHRGKESFLLPQRLRIRLFRQRHHQQHLPQRRLNSRQPFWDSTSQREGFGSRASVSEGILIRMKDFFVADAAQFDTATVTTYFVLSTLQ